MTIEQFILECLRNKGIVSQWIFTGFTKSYVVSFDFDSLDEMYLITFHVLYGPMIAKVIEGSNDSPYGWKTEEAVQIDKFIFP